MRSFASLKNNMKRILFLLLFLLSLSGCRVFAECPPEKQSDLPPVVVMSSPDTEEIQSADSSNPITEQYPQTEPKITEPVPSQPVQTELSPSHPAQTEPPLSQPASLPFQDGDTTPTWRPELAESYPADADCSAELLLEKWMAVEGLTTADLDRRGCAQLILVIAQQEDAVETVMICFDRDDGGCFVPVNGLSWLRSYVGKAGILHDRWRNTNTSPAGLWALSFAFGNEPPPEGMKLPWRQVTPNSDWVCDEDSPYFNTWRERDDPGLIPWSDDVEHLEDYPALYAWACVIEFNRPPDVIPARGCAIFLHCSEKATGGCVGLPHDEMGAVLQWLDPERNPYILITGVQVTP